ncbi:MAG: PEP-CTERM sorting domain-containing protein [Microcystis sp. M53599_WE4]|nr:PEP-CTERM sorting domain-containing protein [Microcystis sp. M53599_WE4]
MSLLCQKTPVLSATVSSSSSTLQSVGIVNDFDKISVILDGILKLWGIVAPVGRPLQPEDFTTIKSARLLIACVNGICDKDESQSNSLVSINKRTVEKTGQVSSIASISGALTQTSIGKNPACVGDMFVDGLSPIKCEKNVKAVGKPGEVFVKNVTASAFGLVYDGRGGRLLMDGAESMDEVYRSREIPEPTSTLSLLSLGILGAGATLKRKVKRSNSTEKEPNNVG